MPTFDFRAAGPDITHWSGYVEFLDGRGRPFPVAPLESLDRMTVTERTAYDEARKDFLSNGVVVTNETITNIADTLANVMRLNRGRTRGGYGVFASAPSGRGKSTALHSVLKEVLNDYRRIDPLCIIENRSCPVAYVCIPDSGTPKSIYMEIADYLGIPYKPHDSDPQMRKIVLNGIDRSGIQVFVVDEVQNLENGGAFAHRAADALRRLVDDSKATYILAGIDLEKNDFMRGPRGVQTANRFLRADVAHYSKNSEAWMSRWKGLVGGMADALPLYATRREDLLYIAKGLHDLTRGSVQALNLVLTQAAMALIDARDPQHETITMEEIEAARYNLATEQLLKARLAATPSQNPKVVQQTRQHRSSPAAPKIILYNADGKD